VIFFALRARLTRRSYPRNVPDDILKTVGEKGAWSWSIFAPGYVRRFAQLGTRRRPDERVQQSSLCGHVHRTAERRQGGALRVGEGSSSPGGDAGSRWPIILNIRRPRARTHVRLGSDFDGLEIRPAGLEGVDKYPDSGTSHGLMNAG